MTLEEATKLSPGLYLVQWLDGSRSICAVGFSTGGRMWMACADSIKVDGERDVARDDLWGDVVEVYQIMGISEVSDQFFGCNSYPNLLHK